MACPGKLKVKLTWRDEDARMIQSMTIEGRHFELTVREQPHGDWHWLITAPGQLVLSGDAPSELLAQEAARDTARALARLAAASRSGVRKRKGPPQRRPFVF